MHRFKIVGNQNGEKKVKKEQVKKHKIEYSGGHIKSLRFKGSLQIEDKK